MGAQSQKVFCGGEDGEESGEEEEDEMTREQMSEASQNEETR